MYTNVAPTALPPTIGGSKNLASATIETLQTEKIIINDIEKVDHSVLYNDDGHLKGSEKFLFDPDASGSVPINSSTLPYSGKITIGDGDLPTIISGNDVNNNSKHLILKGGSTASGTVYIIAGKSPDDEVSSTPGVINIFTPIKTFSTGSINIRTGNKITRSIDLPNDGNTGGIILYTGSFNGRQIGNTGNVTIGSGDRIMSSLFPNGSIGTGSTGNVSITTGNSTTGSSVRTLNGSSGNISLATGNKQSGTGNSGDVDISSGQRLSGTGDSGNVNISSGTNTGTGNSGNISIQSGDKFVNDDIGNTGNILIKTGNKAGTTSDGNSGNITLEIGSITSGTGTRVKGELKFVNISTGSSGAPLLIDNDFNVIQDSSTRAVKYDEVLADDNEDFDVNDVLKLKPKFFKYKRNDQSDFGLIVEDIQDESTLDYLLIHNEDGGTWNKGAMITLLIKHNQYLHKKIEELEHKLDTLIT